MSARPICRSTGFRPSCCSSRPAPRLEEVKFALARLPDVKIVEGNTVLTSSRQALSTLLIGIAAFTAFQLVALLILVSLLFSAIVQERYREVGLLRAMGAKPNQVMTIILTEAAIITGLGGIAGLGFGAAVLLLFARSLGFYFGLLGVPFSWPPLAVLQIGAILAIVVLGDPRSRRRVPAGLAGAPHGALRAHSGRRRDDVTLSAQSLTKRYGAAPGYEAVRDASLELRVGEFVSIVGRSGSGKSTLMAMLGALTKPTRRQAPARRHRRLDAFGSGAGNASAPAASASSSSSRACCRT